MYCNYLPLGDVSFTLHIEYLDIVVLNFNEKPNRVIKNPRTGYKPKNLGSVLECKYVLLNQ